MQTYANSITVLQYFEALARDFRLVTHDGLQQVFHGYMVIIPFFHHLSGCSRAQATNSSAGEPMTGFGKCTHVRFCKRDQHRSTSINHVYLYLLKDLLTAQSTLNIQKSNQIPAEGRWSTRSRIRSDASRSHPCHRLARHLPTDSPLPKQIISSHPW